MEQTGNLRGLPGIELDGKWIHLDEKKMLNLSSNDYLGIASDQKMRQDFLSNLDIDKAIFSSSSSRLLTGNYPVYQKVERLLTDLYKKESALVFSSGYHMNMGILPAIADNNTLILTMHQRIRSAQIYTHVIRHIVKNTDIRESKLHFRLSS